MVRIHRNVWVRAAAGGVLIALSFPPRSWWPLGPVGLACLFLALQDQSPRRRAALGFLGGVALFTTAFAFIWAVGAPLLVTVAEAVAALILALLLLLVGVVTPPGRGALVGAPAAFVVVSVVKSRWPFGGLPGIGIAFGQVAGPLADVARLGGELALVGAVAVASLALAALARRRWLVATVATVAVVGTALTGVYAPDGHTVRSVTVAAVQGGGNRGIDATPYERSYRLQLAAARRVPHRADLVLLPESTAHVDAPLADAPKVHELEGLARRLDATVVVGVSASQGNHRFANTAIAIAPDGRIVGRYDKIHGVPFAEYVPARGLLRHVVDLSLVPSDMIPGHTPGVLHTPAGTAGVVISFEVFFPRRVRATVTRGAEVVLVPTSTSSFTGGQVPAYELAASRLRAIESGRDVVQVSPTGYSTVIDATGTVHGRTPLGNEAAVLTRRIDLRHGLTPFDVAGGSPIAIVATLALAGAWAVELRDRRRARGDPAAGEQQSGEDEDGTTADADERGEAVTQRHAGRP